MRAGFLHTESLTKKDAKEKRRKRKKDAKEKRHKRKKDAKTKKAA